MDVIWDGITRAETLHEEAVQTRHALADAAKTYDWPAMFALLDANTKLVNTTRPDGQSLYAPLHQVAHGGAAAEIAERLIGMLAWRTLQNARGERPVDVAERMNHHHLLGVLAPQHRHRVPPGVLLKIQAHFHAVILGRAEREVQKHNLRLPELEPMLELERPKVWFAVPGMYGGFSYWLEFAGTEAKLVAESWCRVVDGSGQRHEVTCEGSRLVDEGFA